MAAENNIVGEVGLRVTPVDTTFNRDLQRIIDKAPKFVDQKISPQVDTASFIKATDEITKGAQSAASGASDALSNIGAGINTAQFDAATNQLVQGAEQAAEQASNSFAKIAVGVGVGAAALYGLKQAVDITVRSLSGLFDNLLKAQAGFQAILGNTEGDKLLADIQEFARVTPFSTEGLVQYSQQLLGVGRSAESIIPTLTSVGDLVASKGGDSETIGRVLFTLTQIQSVGRLIGQDAMQLQSALIPITKLLADSMGKTQAEIKALSAAGKISADTVFKTLEEAGLDVAGAMDGATRNIGGAREGLTDTIQILAQKSPVLIKINQDIVDAIKNLTNFLSEPRVAELTEDLSVSFEKLYTSIQPLFGQITSLAGDAILTTLEAALPLIQGLGGVLEAIPVEVLTAIGAFLAFSKFQAFITGFGKATSLLTNFQGTLGGIGAGLNRATSALTSNNLANTQAQSSQAALIRTYNQTGAAASTAAIQTEAYTQALRRQSIEAQKAVAAAFAAPPTGPAATGPAATPKAAAGRGVGLATAGLGAAGFLALSQSGNVEGAGGDALGIAGSAATGAALGAIYGPYGIAAGAAAGLAFGVFTEFNKNAREDAEKKASEWGEIGAKSAQAFVEGFNRDFDTSAGGTASASERAIKSAQIAADVATLKTAQETGVVGEATKAAADRLGVKLEIDTKRPQLGITETPGGFTPAGLVGRGLGVLGFGDGPAEGEFIDRAAFGAQIADLEVLGEERAAELAKQRKVIEGIIGNPIAATWFDNIRDREIGEIVAPFGAVGEAVRGVVDAGAGLVVPFDLVGRSLGESFDYLQDFGIGIDEAVKLGDKIAFYFNDTLGALQGSVDASQKWNTALAETKASLDGINKEVLGEANARLAGINDAEAGEKRILALREGASSKDVAGAAIEALKSAATQAALDTAGGTVEEAAIRQNQLFVASIKDIQEQVGLTDEQLQEYLRTVGLADQFEIASESEATRIAEIRTEIEALEAIQATTGPRNKGRIAAQVLELERQITAIEGVSTAESRLQQERDERNANALPLVKAAEAVQAAYASAVAATIDGSAKLGQFGDVAQQALGRAQAQGESTAEDNQIFVDSIEQIQLAFQYTDDEIVRYLDSVGLLDAYNKALVDSNTGVATSVSEMATQYGLTTDEVRTLFGLIEDIPNDATIYISAEISAAMTALDVVEQRIADLAAASTNQNLSGQERAAASRALDEARRRERELEDEIRAAGGDVNAVTGTRARLEAEAAAKAQEEKEKADEKARKEQEAAAKQAQQELERWQNLVESTTSNLTSQLESAANNIADAAERWVGSIKERTEYEVAVSASRLANNADRQSRDLEESQAGLENLRGRGVTDEVLQALGIDNVGDTRQIRKLVRSSDSDLQRLTASVANRDELAQKLALSEEDKRTRTNITAAIVDAAKALDLDLSADQATAISNQFNITPNLNAEELAFQILGILSGGRITR